jgi:hypothetical protein
MSTTLLVHIFAGTLGLIAGYIALFSFKGGAVHRKGGTLFVYAMSTMCVAGLTIAVVRGVAPEINVPAALLTSYLAITALITVRPVAGGARPLAVVLMLVALGVGVVMLTFAAEAFANGGRRNGMPAFPFVMFGVIGMLGFLGDLRVLRTGALEGSRRLARHLWRMSFALFIAALSFSVQAAKLLSRQGIKLPGPVIALPMLIVLVAMFYWLWRVRGRRSLANVVRVAAPEAVGVN